MARKNWEEVKISQTEKERKAVTRVKEGGGTNYREKH